MLMAVGGGSGRCLSNLDLDPAVLRAWMEGRATHETQRSVDGLMGAKHKRMRQAAAGFELRGLRRRRQGGGGLRKRVTVWHSRLEVGFVAYIL
jgi:hypothetical protein